MPNASLFTAIAPALLVGAAMLMIMDACFNLAMEPFRALVADNLPDSQRTMGFSVQTFLIGIGAVVGSAFPFILNKWFNISNSAPEGVVAANVKWAFYIGAAVFIIAILITVLLTKEYSPAEYEKYHGPEIVKMDYCKSLKILQTCPKLCVNWTGSVFSWFVFFLECGFFTNDAVATHGLSIEDKAPITHCNAGDWVGLLFSIYNGVSAVFALLLPFIAMRIGQAYSCCFTGMWWYWASVYLYYS